jgi:PAS domain S-box-containing protein
MFNKDESEPYQIYSVFEDITVQKLAEKEIRKREQLFRSAFDDGAVPMTITSKEGRFLKVNHAFCKLVGYTEEELSGLSFPQITHPDDIEVSFLPDEKNNNNEKTLHTIEKRYVRKDGRIIWVNLSSAPVRDESDELFVSHAEDITKRKYAELRLKESREKYKHIADELKASRERLNIALENGQIGTWEIDIMTNKVTWDERTEKMFGFAPGSFGGTYDDFLNSIHEEDVPHMREAIEQAAESKTAFETIFRTKPIGGSSNYISAKALVTRNTEGRPVSLVGVCFDVTSMKEGAEQALIKLNEELLRSNTDLQQFAYVASHDLQEPLRMVSSFTQLLQQRYSDKLDADANEYIRFAVEGSKRMYDLLNGLLTYSRIQTRGKDFRLVDMNLVAAKVRDNLNLVIEKNNATVEVKDLPEVTADENQMIQLLQNLLENSLKFKKDPAVITISAVKGEYSYVFSIRDNGIGIEKQYFDRIFKIFQRLHRSEEYEGTGIGLAICKRIVERHGGKIWIESDPEVGSTFFFSIPFRTDFDISIQH